MTMSPPGDVITSGMLRVMSHPLPECPPNPLPQLRGDLATLNDAHMQGLGMWFLHPAGNNKGSGTTEEVGQTVIGGACH